MKIIQNKPMILQAKRQELMNMYDLDKEETKQTQEIMEEYDVDEHNVILLIKAGL